MSNSTQDYCIEVVFANPLVYRISQGCLARLLENALPTEIHLGHICTLRLAMGIILSEVKYPWGLFRYSATSVKL